MALAGQRLTAARLGRLGGAWVSGTPTWSQAGGTILAIGSGTLLMRYKDIGLDSNGGKTVHARLEMVRASGSNIGSNTYAWTIPGGWPLPRTFRFTGTGAVYLAAGGIYPCVVVGISADTFALQYTTSAARVAQLNPAGAAWATNDAIVADLTYEAA